MAYLVRVFTAFILAFFSQGILANAVLKIVQQDGVGTFKRTNDGILMTEFMGNGTWVIQELKQSSSKWTHEKQNDEDLVFDRDVTVFLTYAIGGNHLRGYSTRGGKPLYSVSVSFGPKSVDASKIVTVQGRKILLVASEHQKVFLFDALSGQLLYEIQTTRGLYIADMIFCGDLLIVSTRDNVEAYRGKTLVWRRYFPRLGNRIDTLTDLGNNRLALTFGYESGGPSVGPDKLLAINSGADIGHMEGSNFSYVIDRDRIYAAVYFRDSSTRNEVIAYDRSSLQRIWNWNESYVGSIVKVGNHIIAGSNMADSAAMSLSADTGTLEGDVKVHSTRPGYNGWMIDMKAVDDHEFVILSQQSKQDEINVPMDPLHTVVRIEE